MNVKSITRIAGLIGEPGRIQMLTTMLDGNAHTASALAMAASVSPQAASSHLSKLLSGDLIVSEQKGRQRLFRLKSREVAVAIEALGAICEDSPTLAIPEIRFARSCYDHLAGVLAIAVRNELLKRGALRYRKDAFLVTPAGKKFFIKLGIDADSLGSLRRSFAHKCLDWTERHHHIGGAVGAALLGHFLEMKWLARMSDTRAVRLTHAGERGFEHLFDIRCTALRAQTAPSLRR